MKTYTIRPLEWNPVRSRMYAREAVVPGGRYLIDRAVVDTLSNGQKVVTRVEAKK